MALTTLVVIVAVDLHRGAGIVGILSAGALLVEVAVTFGISSRLHPEQLELAVAISLVLLAVALVGIGLSHSIDVTAAACLFLGVSAGIAIPGLPGLVQNSAFDDAVDPGTAVTTYTMMLSLALAIGPPFESFLLDIVHNNVRWPYFVFAGLVVIALTILLWRRRIGPSGRKAERAVHVRGEVFAKRGSSEGRLFTLLRKTPVRLAFLAQLLYVVPFTALIAFGAAFARMEYATSAAIAELTFTGFFVVSLVTRGVLAWVSPVRHKDLLYLTSGILTTAGVMLLALGHSFAFFIIGMLVFGVPHGLIFPLALSALSESVPRDVLPKANSMLMVVTNTVAVAASVSLGALASATSYRVMIAWVDAPVLVVFAAIGVVVVLDSRSLFRMQRE